MNDLNPLKRSFELAANGQCGSIQELQRRLKLEGYSSAAAHLASPSLRKQLAALIKGATFPLVQ